MRATAVGSQHHSTSKRAWTVSELDAVAGRSVRGPLDAHAVDHARRWSSRGPRPSSSPSAAKLAAWWRETFESSEHDVAVAAAADHGAGRPDHEALALGGQDRPCRARGLRLGELVLRRAAAARRSSCAGVARRARARRRRRRLGRPGRGAPRSRTRRVRSRSSVRNSITRSADEREALRARVLEQVGGQLVGDLALDSRRSARGPAARGRRRTRSARRSGPARRSGARPSPSPAARELDGPHLGAEDATEAAFDETGELGLEVAQNAHR